MNETLIQQLFPRQRPISSPDDIYTQVELAFPTNEDEHAPNPSRPYIYFNMVSSVDGRGMTAAQSAEGLGTALDRRIMHRLRLAADAVLVGAETFRRDPVMPTFSPDLADERARYFPDAPQPWGIVVSGDGKIPLDKKFFEDGPARRLVVLGENASAEREAAIKEKASVVRVGNNAEGRPDNSQLLSYLYTKLSIRRLLCEGGPRLNYDLISRGLADELFWTLAPKLVAGERNHAILTGPIFPMDNMPTLRLQSLYEQAGEMFFRYKIGQ